MQPISAVNSPKGKADGAPKVEARAPVVPLKTGDATLYDISNNRWRVVAPQGATPDQLDQHPDFWNLLGDGVRAGDDITVIAADRSWTALFSVVDAGPGYVAAALAYTARCPLRTATGGAKQIPEDWEIVRTGPKEPDGWIARNKVNGKRIENSGMPFESHEAARRGLLDHAIFQNESATKYVA